MKNTNKEAQEYYLFRNSELCNIKELDFDNSDKIVSLEYNSTS